jgi:hypothetical protein
MAISYAKDIKPMFTAMDQDHMLNDQGMFDLWDYNDVKTHAAGILRAVKSGRMPPPGEEPRWSPEMVQKFQDWINESYPQ